MSLSMPKTEVEFESIYDVLIMPGELEFEQTLLNAWDIFHGRVSQFCVFGVDGLPRPVSDDELDDYLEGGEYSERCGIIEVPEVVGIEFE